MNIKDIKSALSKILKKEQDFDKNYCEELYQDAEKEMKSSNFIDNIVQIYPDKKCPFIDDQIILFLIAFYTITVGCYFFDDTEYYKYLDNVDKKYANKIREYYTQREKVTQRESMERSLEYWSTKKDEFRDIYNSLENETTTVQFFNENLDLKAKWIRMVDEYCETKSFKYTTDIVLNDKGKVVEQIIFPITGNQEQTLIFKNKLTEKEAVDRISRWLSKPLSFVYYESVKEDTKYDWKKLPKEWQQRWNCLPEEFRILVKIEKDDDGCHKLITKGHLNN